mgnify:CR=1 FL=1
MMVFSFTRLHPDMMSIVKMNKKNVSFFIKCVGCVFILIRYFYVTPHENFVK